MAPTEQYCPRCDGTGIDPDASHDSVDYECPDCEGYGVIETE